MEKLVFICAYSSNRKVVQIISGNQSNLAFVKSAEGCCHIRDIENSFIDIWLVRSDN